MSITDLQTKQQLKNERWKNNVLGYMPDLAHVRHTYVTDLYR